MHHLRNQAFAKSNIEIRDDSVVKNIYCSVIRIWVQIQVFKSRWCDGSAIKSTCSCKDTGLGPSTHVEAYNYLWLQF